MDIERPSAYLPMDRRHALATGRSLPDRAEGAVLMADISGFTPLTDALAATLGPQRGAEELTRLLNSVYNALIDQVHRYGGSVISFMGDALVCWFEGDPGLRAVTCGLAMQEVMRAFAAVRTPDGGEVSFSIKGGVAAGPVRRFLVGLPHVDLLAGATLDRMAAAEQVASGGEIVLAPQAARQLDERLQVVEWRDDFAAVRGLLVEPLPTTWPGSLSVAVEQVRPFLLPPVHERLLAGQGEFLAELRPAVALFLRFEGLDYEHDEAGSQLDAFVRRVQEVLARERVYDLQGAREAESQDLEALERLANALDDDGRRGETALRRSRHAEVMGDYPASIAAAQTAIDLARAAQDVKHEALGYRAWGRALTRKGDYEAARQRFEQALSLAKAAGARKVEAASLQTLGIVCYHQGNYGGARDYYARALCISRETGDRSLEGYVLSNLGLVFTEQGDHAKAREHYEQALRIVGEIGYRRGEGELLSNMGLISHQLGDDKAALEYSQQALRIARELGDRHGQGHALTCQGHALSGLGYRSPLYPEPLAGLVASEAAGRLAEATDAYRQALDLRRELGQHNLATEPLAGLARVSLAQGNLVQAQAHVEGILSYLESNTLDGTDEPFRVYLTCYQVLKANQDPRAQNILDSVYALLQEQADQFPDEEARRFYLENVPAHREIVAAYQAMQEAPGENG